MGSLNQLKTFSSVSLVLADCVAKLYAALRTRNNRIQSSGALNRSCVLAQVLESMLRILVAKIVLQHNRPKRDLGGCQQLRQLLGAKRTTSARAEHFGS
jgi:hypothetical protein